MEKLDFAKAKGQSFKSRYSFSCPECGKKQAAAPSMHMTLGVNSGMGGCIHCKALLSLAINSTNDAMIAERQEDFASNEKRRKIGGGR